jgi:hypothetical protein
MAARLALSPRSQHLSSSNSESAAQFGLPQFRVEASMVAAGLVRLPKALEASSTSTPTALSMAKSLRCSHGRGAGSKSIMASKAIPNQHAYSQASIALMEELESLV